MSWLLLCFHELSLEIVHVLHDLNLLLAHFQGVPEINMQHHSVLRLGLVHSVVLIGGVVNNSLSLDVFVPLPSIYDVGG